MAEKLTKSTSIVPTESKETSTSLIQSKLKSDATRGTMPSLVKSSGMKIESVLRTMAEVSKVNYLSMQSFDVDASSDWIKYGKRANSSPIKSDSTKELNIEELYTEEFDSISEEDIFPGQFPAHLMPLLNENQLWGCFYILPEIYSDAYTSTVRIRSPNDVPELVDGVLTRDLVTACLSYLKRTPILGDFVFIKLDVSSKLLRHIDVLQHYKYLVYLDLSSNFLTELTVLSHLLYLQFLSVDYNKLTSVLEYETPQWFLTEVHYKFNSVTKIRDMSTFWSITVLDLSHNNIKNVSGVECLRYLRRLDLSFNHIQRLENLNHMCLLWLDVSYNNISSFEISATTGLWTLLQLEYLNLNENNLSSMKIFSGCTRLRELHARNNRLSVLLELVIYMSQMRRLGVIDLRGNPVCTKLKYKEVVVTKFPLLLWLDSEELDPVEQSILKMNMSPDIYTFATRRLSRLLFIEKLSRGRVSPHTPPADTIAPPLIVLVGYEAVGKGKLARRLVQQCGSHVERGYLHTTAPYHTPGHYKLVTRSTFDDMLIEGEFLTYAEMNGESYGLSREEAVVNKGKVKIVCMDLVSGLMLLFRGLRPYLILITTSDKGLLAAKQKERKNIRNNVSNEEKASATTVQKSSLQNLLSGRFLISGILNEILLTLPEEKVKEEFILESDCSLMMDSEARLANKDYRRELYPLSSLSSSATSTEVCKQNQEASQIEKSSFTLYKGLQSVDEFESFGNERNFVQDFKTGVKRSLQSVPHPKSVDFTKYASSTVKDGSKSSKSVTFTSQEQGNTEESTDPTGLVIDPRSAVKEDKKKTERSLSIRMSSRGRIWRTDSEESGDDSDLWLAFLMETGLIQSSSTDSDIGSKDDETGDDADSIVTQLAGYNSVNFGKRSLNARDDYEDIHNKNPGIFWDTVNVDNFDNAFRKMKTIIQNITLSQAKFKPMYNIDFTSLSYYPTVQTQLKIICNEIAPQQLFN